MSNLNTNYVLPVESLASDEERANRVLVRPANMRCHTEAYHGNVLALRGYDVLVPPKSEGQLEILTDEENPFVAGFSTPIIMKPDGTFLNKSDHDLKKMYITPDSSSGPKVISMSDALKITPNGEGLILNDSLGDDDVEKGYQSRLEFASEKAEKVIRTEFALLMANRINQSVRDDEQEEGTDESEAKETMGKKFKVGDSFSIKLSDLGIGGYDTEGLSYSYEQKPALLRRVNFLKELLEILQEKLNSDFSEQEDFNVLFDISINSNNELVVLTREPEIKELFEKVSKRVKEVFGGKIPVWKESVLNAKDVVFKKSKAIWEKITNVFSSMKREEEE